MVYNALRRLSFRLFPGQCLLCLLDTERQRDLCLHCEQRLPWLRQQCPRCALPLAVSALCPDCQHQAPLFERCLAAFEYTTPMDRLVNGFKHHGNRHYAHLLAECWLQTHADTAAADALVPVPLHWQRQLSRGFNQAEWLAERWAEALQLPLLNRSRRLRKTQHMQSLGARQRQQNLRPEDFRADPRLKRYRHVAIVDDVMTTGSTAAGFAGCLLDAGAESVSLWVAARTPKNRGPGSPKTHRPKRPR